jgi:hypothetical protein
MPTPPTHAGRSAGPAIERHGRAWRAAVAAPWVGIIRPIQGARLCAGLSSSRLIAAAILWAVVTTLVVHVIDPSFVRRIVAGAIGPTRLVNVSGMVQLAALLPSLVLAWLLAATLLADRLHVAGRFAAAWGLALRGMLSVTGFTTAYLILRGTLLPHSLGLVSHGSAAAAIALEDSAVRPGSLGPYVVQLARNFVGVWWEHLDAFFLLALFLWSRHVLTALERNERLVPAQRPPRCEDCGYDLRALSGIDQCPECGRDPVAGARMRRDTAWQRRPSPVAWLTTSFRALFRPRRSYRALRVDRSLRGSNHFAAWHCLLLFVGACVCGVAMQEAMSLFKGTGQPYLTLAVVGDTLGRRAVGMASTVIVVYILSSAAIARAWASADRPPDGRTACLALDCESVLIWPAFVAYLLLDGTIEWYRLGRLSGALPPPGTWRISAYLPFPAGVLVRVLCLATFLAWWGWRLRGVRKGIQWAKR